ncbi:MAG: hypothetical protein CM1200mP30_02840 [Pseudomonadota bacterium]|nr:MAG: hypothetical protein CM1200mP30_02840 [Pseudomonadota bacterium]
MYFLLFIFIFFNESAGGLSQSESYFLPLALKLLLLQTKDRPAKISNKAFQGVALLNTTRKTMLKSSRVGISLNSLNFVPFQLQFSFSSSFRK